ncbi:histidine phosphatase family protein [Gracilibacillus alcaliphilus]|uniref:histidine phosphatase family protein n=1 Tax=Gracilibacillus alcaliphilus TaxID=1401441 RepID=UPI00195A360F|nr:histidine phosphatase family protein [Gracilibacillus alcaliphilus]MBM7676447.1 2,3-bisphosphoglycerate-dependent phosphoglycerate mutase [Gracilibacillus alcaliphilus]
MYTKVNLVRHAHSTYTPDEYGRPLSEKGLKDAEMVTDRLAKEKIDIVYASPYKRAIQTVEGIAQAFDFQMVIEPGFKERKLAGQTAADFSAAMEQVWSDPAFSFPGGESNQMAQKRGAASLQQVIKQHQGQGIVIGTHGNIMVLMMNYFDAQYDFGFWQQLTMPDIYQLTFQEQELVGVKRLWRG